MMKAMDIKMETGGGDGIPQDETGTSQLTEEDYQGMDDGQGKWLVVIMI